MGAIFLIITKSGERKARFCGNTGLMSFLISIGNHIGIKVEKLMFFFAMLTISFVEGKESY